MKTKVFVASSEEGLEIAYALQEQLSARADVMVWSQLAFRATQNGLSPLLETAQECDVAIFVLTAKDLIASTGATPGARDVVLELGLFLGALGRERVFVLTWGTSDRLKLPHRSGLLFCF